MLWLCRSVSRSHEGRIRTLEACPSRQPHEPSAHRRYCITSGEPVVRLHDPTRSISTSARHRGPIVLVLSRSRRAHRHRLARPTKTSPSEFPSKNLGAPAPNLCRYRSFRGSRSGLVDELGRHCPPRSRSESPREHPDRHAFGSTRWLHHPRLEDPRHPSEPLRRCLLEADPRPRPCHSGTER